MSNHSYCADYQLISENILKQYILTHANNICQISRQCVVCNCTQGYTKVGDTDCGEGGGSVEQWPSCLTNQPCMDTQNTLEHRTNRNNIHISVLVLKIYSSNTEN